MANILDQIFGNRGEQTLAQEVATQSLPAPNIAGGLAGILAASVFGGPIGLGVGLLTGMASGRMRQNISDAVAADLIANDRLSRGIFEQIEAAVPYAQQFGTEQDLAQLGDIAHSARRLQELSQHHDPAVRARAVEGLLAQDARFDAWRQDIEDRTRVEADAMFQVRLERAKQIQDIVNEQFRLIRDVEVETDTVAQMLNDLGIGNAAVQSRLRKLADFGSKEAKDEGTTISLAPFGIGASFDVGTHEFTDEEAWKLISGVRKAQTERRLRIIAEINREAEADGFRINAQEGEVLVEDLNTNVFEILGRGVEPDPGRDMSPPKSLPERAAEAAGDFAKDVGQALRGATKPVSDALRNMLPNQPSDLSEGADVDLMADQLEARAAAAERAGDVEKARRIRSRIKQLRRRPTN